MTERLCDFIENWRRCFICPSSVIVEFLVNSWDKVLNKIVLYMLIRMSYHLVNRTIHEIQQDWGLFKIEKQTIIILKYTKISTELLNEPSNFNIFFFTLSLFAELSSISDVLSSNLELNPSFSFSCNCLTTYVSGN